jgi:hypothetical protein
VLAECERDRADRALTSSGPQLRSTGLVRGWRRRRASREPGRSECRSRSTTGAGDRVAMPMLRRRRQSVASGIEHHRCDEEGNAKNVAYRRTRRVESWRRQPGEHQRILPDLGSRGNDPSSAGHTLCTARNPDRVRTLRAVPTRMPLAHPITPPPDPHTPAICERRSRALTLQYTNGRAWPTGSGRCSDLRMNGHATTRDHIRFPDDTATADVLSDARGAGHPST